jgi:hypothetical protein
MELLPWIKKDKLCSTQLNLNSNALDYIIKYNIQQYPLLLSANMSPNLISHILKNEIKLPFKNSITIENICKHLFTYDNIHYERCILLNPRYISLIEQNIEVLNERKREILYGNPAALHLLCLNPAYIAWDYLSQNTNPEAIKILKENIDSIYWIYLSANPAAVEILTANQDRIIFRTLARNPNAMELIKKYMHKISLIELSYNTNPEALQIVEKQLDKLITWGPLSMNPSAIKILERNQDKIDWYCISQNSAIFEYNYLKMAEERMQLLREELMMKALHPSRIAKHLAQGLDIDDL